MPEIIISYFAKIREQLGRDEDIVDLPDHVQTIDDAIEYLAMKSSDYSNAFSEREKLRYALDNEMASGDANISGKKELVIFPPVTGG